LTIKKNCTFGEHFYIFIAMKKGLFSIAIFFVSTCLYAQTTMHAFSELGYKKQVMYTSSKGEFEEFHDQTDVVEIGSVLFNTKTNQVVGFVSEEKGDAEVSAVTAAMSIDPLCEKYYWISPYAYCLNNPINAIDKDGRKVVYVHGYLYGDMKGGKDYWTNSFVSGAQSFFKDNTTPYFTDVEHGLLSSASGRHSKGYEYMPKQIMLLW
jgi:hypothetical protein